MSDDMYADDNLDVLQDSEIGEPGPGVFAPHACRLAGLEATHHHDADYGLPDTTVRIAEDSSGASLSCSHGGVSYDSGDTAVVPSAVAQFWVRSGWVTTELEVGGGATGSPDESDEPRTTPPLKSKAARRSAAPGTRRKG